MIRQVSGSGIMETDMKVSGKMTKSMAKVRNKSLLYDLLILTLFDDSIGTQFGNDGNRYEGEWKDGKKHGQGKKEISDYFMIY